MPVALRAKEGVFVLKTSHSTNNTRACGMTRRLMAMVYDSVIVFGLLLIATAVASPFDQGNQQLLVNPVFTLYIVLAGFAYFAFFWTHGGMTVGMRAWHVLLVAESGKTVDWKSCLVRYLTAWLSLAMFGLGFWWSLFDENKRGWHDITSHTRLVNSKITEDSANDSS